MELNRLNLVFPILAIALILSLFGCDGADSNPTSLPVTTQSLPTTVAPTPTQTSTRTPIPTITPPVPSEGVFGIKWGAEGTGDRQFGTPMSVAVASDGSIYVSDRGMKDSLNPSESGNQRIQKFTFLGDFVSKWGTEGTDDGEFSASRTVSAGAYMYERNLKNHLLYTYFPPTVVT